MFGSYVPFLQCVFTDGNVWDDAGENGFIIVMTCFLKVCSSGEDKTRVAMVATA